MIDDPYTDLLKEYAAKHKCRSCLNALLDKIRNAEMNGMSVAKIRELIIRNT